MNKTASVVVPDEKTAARIRRLGFSDVAVIRPWESRLVSKVTVTALPADHPVPERTYVIAFGDQSVFFGGDTRYIKDFKDVGEKFNLTAALLPISGLSLPLAGKVVMDPIEAAEAAALLKAPVAIPIHHNMSLTLPLLKGLFDKAAAGSPEQFAAEVGRRNRQIKVVTLRPGETWQGE
jgi:L-ascorbate metabolism protein UlaG (beta-lactamase superfamily)